MLVVDVHIEDVVDVQIVRCASADPKISRTLDNCDCGGRILSAQVITKLCFHNHHVSFHLKWNHYFP